MTETITLAGGCFWCTEAVFASLKGVVEAIPGYSGGNIENPSYSQVASGTTGHAESVQITFDPKVIPLTTLLEVFFKLHDSTQLNKQGADVGTQYRSAIFYNSEDQKEIAESTKAKIKGSVTEVAKFKNFYPASEEHRNYYFKNRGNAYCTLVIDPKIAKLKKDFSELVKK